MLIPEWECRSSGMNRFYFMENEEGWRTMMRMGEEDNSPFLEDETGEGGEERRKMGREGRQKMLGEGGEREG
jgi:hypothetical protein